MQAALGHDVLLAPAGQLRHPPFLLLSPSAGMGREPGGGRLEGSRWCSPGAGGNRGLGDVGENSGEKSFGSRRTGPQSEKRRLQPTARGPEAKPTLEDIAKGVCASSCRDKGSPVLQELAAAIPTKPVSGLRMLQMWL